MDPTNGSILGAQGVGRDGVTAPGLADLELAYAPPFGSAKDPVNMLGYIAENLLSALTTNAQSIFRLTRFAQGLLRSAHRMS
ncbi:MAG: hypothetical protein F2675_01495 [Actinobacteria bacterium]|nr:hypothetical protein [Actinomycetota bacterium]